MMTQLWRGKRFKNKQTRPKPASRCHNIAAEEGALADSPRLVADPHKPEACPPSPCILSTVSSKSTVVP
eukprot:1035611-Rhodomonas_salina.3